MVQKTTESFLYVCGFAAIAACGQAGQQSPADARSAQLSAAVDVPASLPVSLLPRERVADKLANPRGLFMRADGTLLVSIAGTGDPANPMSGGIMRLRDTNGDGDMDDEGERSWLLEQQLSRNIFDLVRRDEVFGMAGMSQGGQGGNDLLVSLAFFGGPSKIFRVDGDKVSPWGETHGNVNDLDYDSRRNAWVAVASTTDEMIELLPGGKSQRVAKFAPLKSGQDAVPSNLHFDAQSGDVLVTLFSGSPEGEEGGEGVELIPRAASIVSVHAETHEYKPVVTGLTVPTDLEIGPDGSIYVLEFCDAFLEPVSSREQMFGATLHGGFKRFSGRLLRVNRATHEVSVVAQGLDAPTNMTLANGYLYVAEGMGTPGRSIPGPDGKAIELQGFVERIKLP
ncbi:MAG TPA: hypothetical protein VFN67_37970 [Polyangiales bacterium]|nr:hypothetical protein [Polyangiales bacterium]